MISPHGGASASPGNTATTQTAHAQALLCALDGDGWADEVEAAIEVCQLGLRRAGGADLVPDWLVAVSDSQGQVQAGPDLARQHQCRR